MLGRSIRNISGNRALLRCNRALSAQTSLDTVESAAYISNNPFEKPKTFVEIQIPDKPGSLLNTLSIFQKHGVNISRIESRPSPDMERTAAFQVDFEGMPGTGSHDVDNCIMELRFECLAVSFPGERDVPWFPQKVKDMDFTVDTLDGGTDLINDDHPGFKDEEYKERRNMLAETAVSYKQGNPIPQVDYTDEEIQTWGVVFNKLQDLSKGYACKEYHRVTPMLQEHCGFRHDNIPQLNDISDFLQECTGFTLRPIAGLLSARDFLNGLAFRVFFSTQYIRHHSKPLYTPEPDVCHELLGHVPLFADPDFADFSHAIGMASLGASDEDIERLANCYWFSVEFGLLQEEGAIKAYGAGLLSSFGEMEYACSPTRPAGGTEARPTLKPFDPFVACNQTFPITDYQPIYFVADSLSQAKRTMRDFTDSLKRPFHATYDPLTRRVHVDRAVRRLPKTSTLEVQAQKQREFFEMLEREKQRGRAIDEVAPTQVSNA